MDLTPLLSPKSVAVIGGAEARRVMEECAKLGYGGDIWPVNPKGGRIDGVTIRRSIDELPGPPDAAFVAVPRESAVAVVRGLAHMGCRSAVVYTSGFGEVGADELHRDLIDAAGDMPILGPNCYGFVNALDRVALWPDIHGLTPIEAFDKPTVAIVSQSGNVAVSLTFQRRGLPLSHVVSVGNQAVIGIEDVIDALVADGRVGAIGLYLEAPKDALRLGEAAQRAVATGVHVVATRTGNSADGSTIARSHTGAMAGMPEAFEALFDRYGIASAPSIDVLLETLTVLATTGPLPGNNVMAMACSGGEASLLADLGPGAGVQFGPLDVNHADRIAATLGEIESVSNPLDYHTFIWGDVDRLTACLTAAMSGTHDAAVLVLDVPPGEDRTDSPWWATVEAFIAAHQTTGKPAVVLATLGENVPEGAQRRFAATGIACVRSVDHGLAAVGLAARLGREWQPVTSHAPSHQPGKTAELDEAESKALLREWGIPVPASAVATASAAPQAAEAVGFPVAVKCLGLDHKAEVGGMRLHVGSTDAVEQAIAAMPPADHYLIEEMAPAGVELLVSVRRETPVGWLVTLGAGGAYTELIADTVHLLAPVTVADVVGAMSRLRMAPALDGVDVEHVAEVIVHLVTAAVVAGVVEVEVNPLIVHADGIIAVDALATVEAP